MSGRVFAATHGKRVAHRISVKTEVARWALPGLLWQLTFASIPVALLVMMSFWSLQEFEIVRDWSLGNYRRFVTGGIYVESYLRSLWLAGSNAIITIAIALPFAYGLAYYVSRKNQPLIILLVALPLFTSYLMRMYAWQTVLADNGIVNEILGTDLRILYTPHAIRIGLLSYFSTIVILLLYTVMRLVPRELIESARNLGAGEWQIATRVVLPQTQLAMAIGGLFVFILSFGDFMATTLLGGGQSYLFSAQIVDQIRVSNWPGSAALAVVMLVTLVVVFAIAFRAALRRRGE